MSNHSYLILNVGGFQYTIKRDVLLKFPDSFFHKMLQSEWKESSDAIIDIQRNGELFKFIYEYMFYGKLPRNEFGAPLLGDASLKEVLQEAEFYHLPGLVAECKTFLNLCEVEHHIKLYATVLDKIERAKSTLSRSTNYKVVYKTNKPDSLLSLLRSNPFAPAWVSGKLRDDCNPSIFMSTTVQNVNVTELIAAALPSPFGRGTETVLDTNVRDAMEIPASQLGDLAEIIDNIDISSLAPNMELALKPYKLAIYQEGGHFDNHRDTVRDERHIGTLVLILNSEYTGGELAVCHGEQNLLVTGALNWVAMYGDCVHTIRPVTSGTRVSLIFDIWNESDELPSSKKRSCSEMEEDDKNKGSDNEDDEEDEDDDYDDEFWPSNEVRTKYWCKKGTTEATTTSELAPTMVDGNVWNRIYLALDKELKTHKTVSICLEHLYPACQANPDFLKGEDAKLYQMLKDKYSLGVTAINIARSTLESEKSIGYIEFGSEKLLNVKKNILFVPNAMHENNVLYYMPESEHTGNEAQEQQLVYLVAALVVRKQ